MAKVNVEEMESLWAKASKLDNSEPTKIKTAEFMIPILFRWFAEDRAAFSELSRNFKETEELEKRLIVAEAQEKFDAQFTTKEKS
jgi:hypothetical protein